VHLVEHVHYEYQSTIRGSDGHVPLDKEKVVSFWLLSISDKQCIVRAAANSHEEAHQLCAAATASSPKLATFLAQLKVFTERTCNRPSAIKSPVAFSCILPKFIKESVPPEKHKDVKLSKLINTGPEYRVSVIISLWLVLILCYRGLLYLR
jgi:hypothetical protein